MTKEFNVGDVITIKKDLRSSNAYVLWVCPEMEKYAGVKAVIKRKWKSESGLFMKYELNIDDRVWTWTADMFEEGKEEDMDTTNMVLDTIMDKNTSYEVNMDAFNEMKAIGTDLLNDYDYYPTEHGINKIADRWLKAKGWMIPYFEKSPFYNGRFQIVIPAKLHRSIDKEGIRTFKKWAMDEYDKTFKAKQLMVGLHTYTSYQESIQKLTSIYNNLPTDDFFYKGYTRNEIKAELDRRVQRRDKVLDELREKYDGNSATEELYISNGDIWENEVITLPYKEFKKTCEFSFIMENLFNNIGLRENPNLIDAEMAEIINSSLEKMELKVRCVTGQKISKFVGKLLKETGLNHVVKMVTNTWTDPTTGELQSRVKDMGYNYHFALLGDSINPNECDREVVISFNMVDFWTMSFGHKWSSCHTIDKTNRRRQDGGHNYEGMYSGGTESYMLDDSSIIVYIRPTEDELEKIGETNMPMELQSKLKRCMFFLGEDKLIQSRVYPDGRDGGDEGLAGQLREIVQRTIAEMFDTPNMWVRKKGRYECESVIEEGDDYTHYRDYIEYGDGSVCYLKRVNGNLNTKHITVGHAPICPSCGDTHDSHDHITCDRCYGEANDEYEHYCERCGEGFNEGCDEVCTCDGTWYCCTDCAIDSGYEWAEDRGEWCYIDDLRWCEWDEMYYYYTDDGIETVDGCWYHNEECARKAGYEYADIDDLWVRSGYIYECGNSGSYFSVREHEDYIEIDGTYYPDKTAAEDDGYEWDEETETWIAA